MSTETIKINNNNTPKTNWVKQIYFYVVIAFSIAFFCGGLFGTSQAVLVKYIFPKAGNNYGYMGPFSNPEQQCKNGQGSQYWFPKQPIISPDPTKPYTPPVPTDVEIKECIEATNKGIEEQKEQTYQSGLLSGILALIISGLVGATHLIARDFFLRKE
jgi:hypothetical protein